MQELQVFDPETALPKSPNRLKKTQSFDDEAAAKEAAEVEEPEEATGKSCMAIIQTLVTLVMAPGCLIFMATVFVDILVFNKHTGFYNFLAMVIMPGLSFVMSCYMLISYWMDEEGWSFLRRCVMFANIPMCCYYALLLMGQSEYHQAGLSCPTQGFLLQVFYLQMNLWHTMTVVTMYRLVETGSPKFKGATFLCLRMRDWVHIICWIFPIILASIMVWWEKSPYHEDFTDKITGVVMSGVWNSGADGLRGIGWCQVKSSHMLLKAVFVNAPQLFLVSFYAQYYYYIHHQHIDPLADGKVAAALGQTKINTSKNVGMAAKAAARLKEKQGQAAEQQRLYMTFYIMSFLTNTIYNIISDHMSPVTGPPSDANLATQAIMVTAQGFFIGCVFMRNSKGLGRAYGDAYIAFRGRNNEDKAAELKEKRFNMQKKREALDARIKEKRGKKSDCVSSFISGVWGLINTILMFIVGIWVWTPMEFLSENMSNRGFILIGLTVWGGMSVFPIYFFSLARQDATPCLLDGTCHDQYALGAEIYFILVFIAGALGVYQNRYTHYLLMIEGPVRRQGIFRSIGMGMRLTSCRNSMSIFTMTLEFYQIWGLTWSASQMKERYSAESGSLAHNETWVNETSSWSNEMRLADWDQKQDPYVLSGIGIDTKDEAQFWAMIIMCVGWTILYSLPVVLTTITVGNRKLAFNIMEGVRKYLWFMAGAGFLSILKALLKVQFCIPHPAFKGIEGDVPMVPLTTHTIECWSTLHLQMVTCALIALAIFFPSASLTTLFRYDDEDDRCPTKPCSLGVCGPEGKGSCCPGDNSGCVLGGEDMRWIHLWRRVEYMVKGLWVFTGYRLVEYGSLSAVSLFSGSMIIVLSNSMMQPSNLKWVCRWKLVIHMCNCWTTLTCLWANLSDNYSIGTHYAMLIPGWVVMFTILGVYENIQIKKDVFLKPVGDEENIKACAAEAEMLAREIEFISGVRSWGKHWRIVRLVRLAEHADIPVKKIAYEALLNLAYHDQMTRQHSFFMAITPCDPTCDGMLDTIINCEDQEVKNLACKTLIIFLQENIGNAYGVPITFHQYLMRLDDEQDGAITRGILDYCMADHENEGYERDAALLVLEVCTADSNKLIGVAAEMMPKLAEWMTSRGMIEQYIAASLVAMTANRFDLAKQVIEGPALPAMIQMFENVAAQTGQFANESNEIGFFEGKTMPKAVTYNGLIMPQHWRVQPKFEQENVGTGGDSVQEQLTLDTHDLLLIQGELMHLAIQAIVELGGASRAIGRRQILEAGGMKVIEKCLDFNLSDIDSEEFHEIHDDLQSEACRAAHAFLSGAFGMEDIHMDPDFSKYWKNVTEFLEEAEADPEVTEFKWPISMTAVQRRKAHIVCAFKQLPHNSVGGIGDRHVIAYKKVEKPPAETTENPVESKEEEAKAQPAWTDLPENEIYEWNWNTVAETGITKLMLNICRDATEFNVRFQAVDIMLKLVEHDLQKEEDEDEMLVDFLSALTTTTDRSMSLVGSYGSTLLMTKRANLENGRFTREESTVKAGTKMPFSLPAGTPAPSAPTAMDDSTWDTEAADRQVKRLKLRRSEIYKGKALFRNIAKSVYWTQFWYMNSDGEQDVDQLLLQYSF